MSRTRLRGIELGGSRIAIEAPTAFDWSWPGERYEPFVRAAEGAQVYVGVRIGSAPSVPRGGFVYQSRSHRFEIAERGDGWIAAIRGRDGLERTAMFNDDFSEGEVVLTPSAAARGVAPLAHPLDELLVLHRVVRSGGLVLRGSLEVRDGRALVFLGSSEPAANAELPGARRATRTQRFGGQRLVLLPSSDGVCVVGSPWMDFAGTPRPFHAKVDAIHSVHASRAVFADRLDRDEAVTELLEHAIVPIHDPLAAEREFSAAANLIDRVAIVRVGLPDERHVVPFTWGRNDTALAPTSPFIM